MTIENKVDFSQDIYIGDNIVLTFGDGSSIEIISSKGNKYNYSSPYSPIDTSSWPQGMYTVIITDKTRSVKQFNVIDPLEAASTYNQIIGIIKDIDNVIDARLQNGGVYQTSINNKSLMSETLAQLYAMRANYIKRANAELAKMKNTVPDNPIKSITFLIEVENNVESI